MKAEGVELAAFMLYRDSRRYSTDVPRGKAEVGIVASTTRPDI